jgi:dolichol-phosphate mannosyltransferase
MTETTHLIIIPTYNEADNIELMVSTIFSLDCSFHILVIDDGSPDGTSDIVKECQNRFKNQLFLLQRERKLGLGTAYKAGFLYALDHGYDFIYEMDCDFSHDPAMLPVLRQKLESGIDFVIGSRYIGTVSCPNWPWYRILLSITASYYVRLVTGTSIRDTTSGFVGYRNRVIARLCNYAQYPSMDGYGFQIESKFLAQKNKFLYEEVSIVFEDRKVGQSKMSFRVICEALLGVPSLLWKY